MLQKTPLHLLDISIRNYQAIKEAGITNLPADTKWIFLTGENGFGKTSVLRAIWRNPFTPNIRTELFRIR